MRPQVELVYSVMFCVVVEILVGIHIHHFVIFGYKFLFCQLFLLTTVTHLGLIQIHPGSYKKIFKIITIIKRYWNCVQLNKIITFHLIFSLQKISKVCVEFVQNIK